MEFSVSLTGNGSLKHLEALYEALLHSKSCDHLTISCMDCSALQMTESISKLLLENNVIQYLSLSFPAVVTKEAAEHLANALQRN